MKRSMKDISTVALMLSLGVAGIYAQQNPVRMTFFFVLRRMEAMCIHTCLTGCGIVF